MKRDACFIKVQDIADKCMDKAKSFDILDFAIFKVCLFSFGAFLGARFSKFSKKFEFVVILTFLLSWSYLIYRIFFQSDDQ